MARDVTTTSPTNMGVKRVLHKDKLACHYVHMKLADKQLASYHAAHTKILSHTVHPWTLQPQRRTAASVHPAV